MMENMLVGGILRDIAGCFEGLNTDSGVFWLGAHDCGVECKCRLGGRLEK